MIIVGSSILLLHVDYDNLSSTTVNHDYLTIVNENRQIDLYDKQ